MSNKILLENKLGEIEESCEIEKLSISHKEIDEFLKTKQRYTQLLELAKEYNKKLSEIKMTRGSIKETKYAKDNLLCKVIEESKPPFYLKYELFNYKALLLYFMRNFRDNTSVNIEKININIITEIEQLFHLLNIPNKNRFIRKEKIHEKMIYDMLEFENYGNNLNHFKSKIASIGWVKETLKKPDFIYDKSANIAQNLEFDLLFIRKSGSGTKSKKYMYHLVALKNIGKNNFVIVSQFPIEKDRKRSRDENISILHKYVKCNEPIFKRENIELPKTGKLNINNLKRIWKDR